ncbi:hypothetical protein EDO6_05570 [Paenibacillus xylanexedens]|nr:hypothetical protein EDO6_05570 [Paenibacillus xylanexedens]
MQRFGTHHRFHFLIVIAGCQFDPNPIRLRFFNTFSQCINLLSTEVRLLLGTYYTMKALEKPPFVTSCAFMPDMDNLYNSIPPKSLHG